MSINLPIIKTPATQNSTVFSVQFKKFVLEKYLFDGLNVFEIEQKYFNSKITCTGVLARDVLVFFGLAEDPSDNTNKGIYKDFVIQDVIANLEEQNDDIYKEIGNALKGIDRFSTDLNYELIKERSLSTNKKQHIRGINKVYYGTPGCGKSYKVLEEWKERRGGVWVDKEGRLSVSTTFFPDYTNSDFIGQIIPGLNSEKKPTYEFVEGPFTFSLITAFNNPDKDVALIIEELNRGNAAAIFGETFQLLDRDNEGRSQYCIYNKSIIDRLNERVINKPEGRNFENVYLPSNLSIIATMNTSDQNVYPLDTAFQRRWEFEKIRNKFFNENVDESTLSPSDYDNEKLYVSPEAFKLARLFIPGTETSWKGFVETLNSAIANNRDLSFSSEDKQIGVYFLSENELVKEDANDINDAIKRFSEKMLKYIWEDIAKINPREWFIDDCNCLDDVFDQFRQNKLGIFKSIDFPKEKKDER